MEKIKFSQTGLLVYSLRSMQVQPGEYYRASDVDAKISELEAEIERLEKYIDALHKQG